MGSLRYARNLAAGKRQVAAMLSLETLGYYSDHPDSQQYPSALSGFFPSTGNFVAFVGDNNSATLAREAIETFRATTPFPSEGLASSARVPGIGWSDHWSFWQIGVPAIMLTDTALFRYEHYHRPTDTPERIDYPRLARVTLGVEQVIRALLDRDD
jgi:Zn-dependent M28 family amino/carboxypeptidase